MDLSLAAGDRRPAEQEGQAAGGSPSDSAASSLATLLATGWEQASLTHPRSGTSCGNGERMGSWEQRGRCSEATHGSRLAGPSQP